MENNINDKIRVNTYTKLDDSEDKLLDEVFWSSYLWLIYNGLICQDTFS